MDPLPRLSNIKDCDFWSSSDSLLEYISHGEFNGAIVGAVTPLHASDNRQFPCKSAVSCSERYRVVRDAGQMFRIPCPARLPSSVGCVCSAVCRLLARTEQNGYVIWVDQRKHVGDRLHLSQGDRTSCSECYSMEDTPIQYCLRSRSHRHIPFGGGTGSHVITV